MRVRSLRRRLAAQDGYSLVELVTVMAILSTVVTSVTGLFVAGTRSEVDLRTRYDVQSAAVITLGRLRRDVHCSSVAAISTTVTASDTVTLTTPCVTGDTVKWCALAVPGSIGRYRLYRRASTGTCATTDTPYADYLTTSQPFDYGASTVSTLAKLKVTLPVKDTKTMKSSYTLCDFLVLRNSKREDATPDPMPTAC